MIHARALVDGTEVAIRDLEERDIEPILNYWYGPSQRLFATMGIDLARFPARPARAEFFRAMIGADPARDSSFMLIMDLGGKTTAYTLFNHIEPGVRCQAHVHVLDAFHRMNGSLRTVFVGGMLLAYEIVGVPEFVFEPSAGHKGLAAFLLRYGLAPVETYLKPAQGIVREMVVNRYVVRQNDVRAMIVRATAPLPHRPAVR